MIYLYLFGTCFHFIYVFMIIGNDCKQSGGWLTDAIKKMENMKKFFLLMMACGVALWGRA